MIKINYIEPQVVDLYSPDKEFMGTINEYEFNDIRAQIKKAQINGYYCVFNKKVIPIDKDGRITDWYEGFFDLTTNNYIE